MFLNIKGHQNHTIHSKSTVILRRKFEFQQIYLFFVCLIYSDLQKSNGFITKRFFIEKSCRNFGPLKCASFSKLNLI